jgi:hypothetical protein
VVSIVSQTITVKIKLLPTKEQESTLKINSLVSEMVEEKKSIKKSTKDVSASIPSAVKNQAIKDAKSVFQKVKKSKYDIIPVLKKPICIWNNQNYSFNFTHISMPIMVNGKFKKTPIRALMS